LRTDRTALVIIAGHAFVQNLGARLLRNRHARPAVFRLRDAFTELASMI